MKKLLIAVLTVAILVAAGAFLYKHFVTDRITDRGGMENPYAYEYDIEE